MKMTKNYEDVEIDMTPDLVEKIQDVLLQRGYELGDIKNRFDELASSVVNDALRNIIKMDADKRTSWLESIK